jgi:hypothetical protein
MSEEEEDSVPDELALVLKAGDELAPHVREFATSIGLLDPAREIVGGWTDRLQLRREVRRALAVKDAADKVRRLGLPTSAIKDRLLLEVLEGAADEDDPELSNIWSNLLANASIGVPVAPAFPSVLRQLEPIEARLLDAGLRRQQALHPASEVGLQTLEGFADLEWRHLDNLERLALIMYWTGLPMNTNVDIPPRPINVRFHVNPFGEAFVAACTGPHVPSVQAR